MPRLTLKTQCPDHPTLPYGPVIHTLEEATLASQHLHFAWKLYDGCPPNDVSWRYHVSGGGLVLRSREDRLAIRHYEGCDLVITIDDVEYECVGDDETCRTWEKVDGTRVVVSL